MSSISTLISKVTALTNALNSLITKAKGVTALSAVSTPLGITDLVVVNQSGVDKKAEVQDFTGSGATYIPYQTPFIFKASGNSLSTLESGDMVIRWWNTTEFWSLARYNGGTTTLKSSYTIISPIEDL